MEIENLQHFSDTLTIFASATSRETQCRPKFISVAARRPKFISLIAWDTLFPGAVNLVHQVQPL